jgi:archaeal type IV pilus assembly protein PilA
MKKIWKMKKDAVSPVIATILMVAITVVLAAVLYVMVMGFGGNTPQTPTGAFVGSPQSVTNGYKLQFGVISPETKFVDCKVVVTVNGTASTAVAISPPTDTVGTYTMTWTDLGGDGAISNGDYVTMTTTLHNTAYTVTILFASTGGTICSQSWTST